MGDANLCLHNKTKFLSLRMATSAAEDEVRPHSPPTTSEWTSYSFGCVFGRCCVLGHVLRLTTLIPAGWTGWPPFAPLAHPDVIVTSTRTNRIGMNGLFRSFGTRDLALNTIVRTAMSLNMAHTAVSEDGTACTPQPRLKTWLLYERCLVLRRIRPHLRMWLLHARTHCV